jgi:hypothetical protein
LVAGSGPYREPLYIQRSGYPGTPIVFEGNGEVITGFEPLVFSEENTLYVCNLPAEPEFVLSYKGKRLRYDAQTGKITKFARLSVDGKLLQLLPGTDPEGWEISTRDFAVRIQDVSHHVYRNIKATGCNNDGFNLHGRGKDLLFVNIEGSNNLDEGFSAHDDISCEIQGGLFFGNDNGLTNIPSSKMKAHDLQIHSNLGWGLWLKGCEASLSNVKVWDNGLCQIRFTESSTVEVSNVTTSYPEWLERKWLTFKESKKTKFEGAILITKDVIIIGEDPQVTD